MITIGHFPNVSFFKDTITDPINPPILSSGQQCRSDQGIGIDPSLEISLIDAELYYGIPIRMPVYAEPEYPEDFRNPAPTGPNSFFPFDLSLKEAMALFWTVKTWRVLCSFSSHQYEDGRLIQGASIDEIVYRRVSGGGSGGLKLIEDPKELECSGIITDTGRLPEQEFETSIGSALLPFFNFSVKTKIINEFGEEEVSLGITTSSSFQGQEPNRVEFLTTFDERFYNAYGIFSAYGSSVFEGDIDNSDSLSNKGYASLTIPPDNRIIEIPIYGDLGSVSISIQPNEYFEFN